ncbi:hypothetical protein KC320_g231 [Hortaea werneckii]|nr:hypothetical protein KC320_g231 [Hortaea werneckii]
MSAALTTDVDERLLRTTKFPPEFNKKVDTTKVNSGVITGWAAGELKRILGDVDEILSGLVTGFIQDNRYPNIKKFQIYLAGFLDKETPEFCQHLVARSEEAGAHKRKERQRKEAQKQQDAERERERNMARIRQRERGYPNRRGGRGGRDRRDRPPRRDSRSPPPRRGRNDDDSYRRGTDSYVPSGDRQRRRSPSTSRSPSRDRSPPRRRRRSTPGRSRSPLRRSRYSSSPSRERGGDRWGRRDSERYRARSPVDRRVRSRSPRRHRHRRRRSVSSDRRSPPRRNRRSSSPRRSASRDRLAESRSSSPPSQKNTRRKSSNDDLIQRPSHDGSRLSRQPSQSERTTNEELKRRGSEPHNEPTKRPRNSSSVGIEDKNPTNSGAEYIEEHSNTFRDRPFHLSAMISFTVVLPSPNSASCSQGIALTRAVLPSRSAPMTRFMPSVAPPTAPAPDPTRAPPTKPLFERKMDEKKKKFLTQRSSGWYPSLNKRKDSVNDPGNEQPAISSQRAASMQFATRETTVAFNWELVGSETSNIRIENAHSSLVHALSESPPASLAVAGRPTHDMQFIGFGGRRS